jgi:hypothetical protein
MPYQNFVEQGQRALISSGAMEGIDPVAAYRNALTIKLLKGKERESDLDMQLKTVKLAEAALKNMESWEDYDAAREHFQTRIPDSPITRSIKPSSELKGKYPDFRDFKIEMQLSAHDKAKLLQGEPVNFYLADKDGNPKLSTTGQTTEEKMTQKQADALNSKGFNWVWTRGNLTGAIQETPEQAGKKARAKKIAELKAEEEAGTKWGDPYFDDDTKQWQQKGPKGEIKIIKATDKKETDKFAYKKGQLVPVKVGEEIETMQVADFDENGMPIFKPYATAKKEPIVKVDVNIGNKAMTKIGEKMGEEFVKEMKDAQQAATNLKELSQADKILKSGMVTGYGAEYILSFGKALQQGGIGVGRDAVSNTEVYMSLMGKQVGQIIKQFGSGTGLSDADREYAEKIAGGKITLNKESMTKIIDLNKKALTNVVKNYNKKAKQVKTRKGAEDLPYELEIPMGEEERKQIGDKWYIKKNNKWYEE